MSMHSPRELEHPEPESLYPASATYYYYVQSPSSPFLHSGTNAAPNIHDNDGSTPAFPTSPLHSHYENDNPGRFSISQRPDIPATYAPAFSRCSSSRGSNHSSFLPPGKELLESGSALRDGELQRLVVINKEDKWPMKTVRVWRPWWWRYLSFSYARSSTIWMVLQIVWRLIVSAGVGILLFCTVTKPPRPHLQFKVEGVPAFGLGVGVDASGVATNFFTFNCTIVVSIDNRSKFYGLHVDPPLSELFFGTIPLAVHREPEGFYAWIQEITSFQVSVGAKNKPLYGAGRSMQDMLHSRGAVPLVIRTRLRAKYRLIGGIIHLDHYHQSKCFLTLESGPEEEEGLGITTTYAYNSSCT
ncbi:hypothetical protein MLD38_011038 [Melastoma candidum]|uniref:Uncharacterized protein n=1 Tax=Melastoma candidum TaxID=119954 RepID=A0ACB9R1W2_9MYRT|nr:hypothetical protein MLD38_011038 [Melastoma candidum]